MSNIDKRVYEKLKAAAAKAVDNFDPNMFVETRDVLALLDELEEKDKTWAAQDDHINQQADRIELLEKKNGELGKALGAAYKRTAEQADIIAKQEKWIKDVEATMIVATDRAEAAEKRIAEHPGQKRLIGWRMADYTDETADPALAKNWATAVDVLPIFEGDVNTKLRAAAAGKGEAS